MTKRRQPDQLQDQQNKRPNLGDEVNTVNDAIDFLIQHWTSTGSNDIETIARSTNVIDCLNRGTAFMLTTRAYALARAGRQEDAISDAKKAIEHRPEAAEGYIAASDIFSMQGRQQAAIDVLDAGLRSVPSLSKALLQECQAIAKNLQERKIDFVEKLPTEIVTNIFSRLDNDMALISCAAVSKLWRRILLQQCPEIWSAVIISKNASCSSASRLLPRISNHVQSLTVRKVNADILKRLFEMAANEEFQSVTELAIESEPALITEHPMLIISLLRQNLTKLEIHIKGDDSENSDSDDDGHEMKFRLDAALSLCPNMTEFSITSDRIVVYQPPKLLSFGNYQLKRLLIDTPYGHQPILKELMPSCPRLESLSVLGVFSSGIFPLIERHCPSLRHLITIRDASTSQFKDTNGNGQPGLYTLQHGIWSTNDIQAAISIVTKNRRTLATLNLAVYHADAHREGLEQLSVIELCQVKNLRLSCTGGSPHFGIFAASVVRHCPALEAVRIDLCGAVLPEQFFLYLTAHSQLHTLTITHADTEATGLLQFLAHISAPEQKSMLKSFTIVDTDVITDEVLSKLTEVQTLEAITISYGSVGNVTTDGIATFIHKLKAVPQLKSLSLKGIPYLTDRLIVELAELNELQTLSLTDIDDVTFDGVRSLINQLGPLKSIVIEDCGGVDYYSNKE